MLPWLLRQFNVTDDLINHLDQVTFAFHYPWMLWLGLPLLVAAGWFVWWWQRRNLPGAPAVLRGILTALRVVILAVLLLVLAGPHLKLEYTVQQKPVVAVLFDQSGSMELPAGPFDSDDDLAKIADAAGYRSTSSAPDPETRKALNRISRGKLAATVMQNAGRPLTERLSKNFDLRYYGFSADLRELGVSPSKPEFPEPPHPGGATTQIGDALDQLRAAAAGRKLAGVLLFSDGQNTSGRSLTEAGRACGDVNVPVFPVPVGPLRQLQDVAVVGVDAASPVSVGDQVRVAATVESKGFDKRVTKVELKDGDTVLDSKDITLSDTEEQHVDLTFKADKAGARYLTVSVPPQPEEADYLRGNNSDTAFVRVSDEKIKVLFLEGLPRWDFRFLKNAMRRDNGVGGRAGKEPDVVLEAEWRRLAEADRKAALPRTLDQLAEYHTVVLGDASPKMLDSDFIDLLVKAVRERGVGLIVEAGPLYMPHKFDDRLDALLPVRLRRGAPGEMPHGIPSFHMELAPEGQLHDAMRLYDDLTANQNAWTQMPPYYWCAAAEKASPGATVLAWNPVQSQAGGKTPLIAQAYAGQGQVLFVGADSTWLWRQNVGDRFFYKFWGQAIRAVARNDKTTARKSWLEVRPIHVQPGDPAQVELMAFAADGSPRTDAALTVQVQAGGEVGTVDMTADPNVKGRYTGKFTPKNSGEYRLTYAPDGQEPVEARLPVAAAPDELKRPNVNRAALEQLAADSHGKVVPLSDLGSLADAEAFKGETTQIQRSPPPASLWDNWLTLALLVGLYSLDVGLRRLRGLS
jgi:hypothetical protein